MNFELYLYDLTRGYSEKTSFFGHIFDSKQPGREQNDKNIKYSKENPETTHSMRRGRLFDENIGD